MTDNTAREILDQLGARFSPDFDAYASGQLPASRVRCVLCGKCPCKCQRCQAPYVNRFADLLGPNRYGHGEPCGMTLMSGACPRGHDQPASAQ